MGRAGCGRPSRYDSVGRHFVSGHPIFMPYISLDHANQIRFTGGRLRLAGCETMARRRFRSRQAGIRLTACGSFSVQKKKTAGWRLLELASGCCDSKFGSVEVDTQTVADRPAADITAWRNIQASRQGYECARSTHVVAELTPKAPWRRRALAMASTDPLQSS